MSTLPHQKYVIFISLNFSSPNTTSEYGVDSKLYPDMTQAESMHFMCEFIYLEIKLPKYMKVYIVTLTASIYIVSFGDM